MEQVTEIAYALDTFYFLMSGVLVMWMAAGFTMLESGLVRARNTTEILTKNVALYSIASIMYLFFGYQLMYGGDAVSSVIPSFGFGLSPENTASDVEGGAYYSTGSDFFFQVVFVATAMSIISGAVAERMKLWTFLVFAVVLTGVIYPVQGFWTWNGAGWLAELGYSDYAG
ncbi:MAG: ammonium transporter, partial [Ectothiorhodospiraceae bacterium]